jgi:flagellar biogenesis protein FliO
MLAPTDLAAVRLDAYKPNSLRCVLAVPNRLASMVMPMCPLHEIPTTLVYKPVTAIFALVTAVFASAPAFGQFTSAPGDSRYYTPPIADAPSEPAPGEPLLSYRRDEARMSDASSPESPTRLTATPPLDGDSNPLRKAPEPPRETQPIIPSATVMGAPLSEPAVGQAPSAQPAAAQVHSTPPVASNPFPEVPPLAPLRQPAAVEPQSAEPLIHYDAAVGLAAHEVAQPNSGEPAATPSATPTSPADASARRLAPPSAETAQNSAENLSDATRPKPAALPFAFSKLESFSTAGAGLAIVIGLFLICVWMLRRGGAKTSGVLPADAFAVLGRAALTPQSFAHLLRLGNKLVLVAMSPDGIQPLTEVTDPMEVDRLTGLCAAGRGHGPSAEFQQVLAQLSREPARGFLGGEAAEGRRR